MRRAAGAAWSAGLLLLRHEGVELAGYAAFTALLSLFPFILFLTALAGFVGDASLAEQVQIYLFDFAPHEVVAVLRPVILDVLTQRHGDLLTVGIVFALWSASSGLEALRTLLNRSYGLEETRQIWVLRPQSILLVVAGTLVAMVLSGVLLIGPISHLLHWVEGHQRTFAVLRYCFAGFMVIGVLIGIHIILPNARMKVTQVWPGAVVTAVLWTLGAWAFSVYVDNFANFSITYGSLGGIILTLLFFDLAAIIFAYGGELNAALFQAGLAGSERDTRGLAEGRRFGNAQIDDHVTVEPQRSERVVSH